MVFKKNFNQKHPEMDTDADADTRVTTIALSVLCIGEIKRSNVCINLTSIFVSYPNLSLTYLMVIHYLVFIGIFRLFEGMHYLNL